MKKILSRIAGLFILSTIGVAGPGGRGPARRPGGCADGCIGRGRADSGPGWTHHSGRPGLRDRRRLARRREGGAGAGAEGENRLRRIARTRFHTAADRVLL